MLTIIRHGAGACFWCNCEKEDGVEIQASGSKMFLCRKDFWVFLKNRNVKRSEAKQTEHIVSGKDQ